MLLWCAHWTFQCLCWFITLFALEAHCSTPGILESSSALDPQYLSLSRLTLGGLHTINEAAIGEARCLIRERNMGGFHTGIGREHILSCIDRILEGSQLRVLGEAT